MQQTCHIMYVLMSLPAQHGKLFKVYPKKQSRVFFKAYFAKLSVSHWDICLLYSPALRSR